MGPQYTTKHLVDRPLMGVLNHIPLCLSQEEHMEVEGDRFSLTKWEGVAPFFGQIKVWLIWFFTLSYNTIGNFYYSIVSMPLKDIHITLKNKIKHHHGQMEKNHYCVYFSTSTVSFL